MPSRSLVHASLYYKVITETLVRQLLCNSFNFKTENETTVNHVAIYSLMVNPLRTIYNLIRCTHAKLNRKLRLTCVEKSWCHDDDR